MTAVFSDFCKRLLASFLVDGCDETLQNADIEAFLQPIQRGGANAEVRGDAAHMQVGDASLSQPSAEALTIAGSLKPGVSSGVFALGKHRVDVLFGGCKMRVKGRPLGVFHAVDGPGIDEVGVLGEVRARIDVPILGGDDVSVVAVMTTREASNCLGNVGATRCCQRATGAEIVLYVDDDESGLLTCRRVAGVCVCLSRSHSHSPRTVVMVLVSTVVYCVQQWARQRRNQPRKHGNERNGAQIVRHSLTALAVLAALSIPATGGAQQLPGGVSVQDVQAAIAQPISVPAGETITVDLGVPVQAGYSGGGWQVSTSGTQVTVTAPAEGGSTISVPAQAAGYSATITLVSDPVAEAPAPAPAPAPDTNDGDTSTGTGDAGNAGGSGADGSAAPATHPDRQQASPVSDTEARRIDLTAEISGNTLTAQLGMLEAARLYNEFSGVDQQGLKIRYVDANGQIIEGVKRNIDKASRTLTLTYPDGETPDNPFIIQVVRDGETAIAIVTLTDPNAPGENASPTAGEDTVAGGDAAQDESHDDGSGSSVTSLIGIAALAGVGVLVLLAVILTVGRKRD